MTNPKPLTKDTMALLAARQYAAACALWGTRRATCSLRAGRMGAGMDREDGRARSQRHDAGGICRAGRRGIMSKKLYIAEMERIMADLIDRGVPEDKACGLAPHSSFRSGRPRPRLLSETAREWIRAVLAGLCLGAFLIGALVLLPLVLPHGFAP